MVVSLPMYAANPAQVTRLWSQLAASLEQAGLSDVPQALAWPEDCHAHWLEPGLLMSQACGYPLVTSLRGKVRVVGAFGYTAEGCDGIRCRSQLVVRADDHSDNLEAFRGRTVAYNGTESQSGYNSLRAMLATLAREGTFFASHVESGSHRRSVELVRDGAADIASIDCVSLANFRRYSPEVSRGIRVLASSEPYPGLPLVTSASTSDTTLQALRDALVQAMRDPTLAATREALFIDAFEPVDATAYQVCADMRESAFARGYRTL